MIMNRLVEFDYFYGAEAEQFSFIRLPKLLFTDRHFRTLSFEAKVVYGILLDRMSLSVKNGWIDEDNRVYLSFTVTSLAEEIGCSRDKAGRILSELDDTKGIGLVERKRRGLGKPDIMYVKNFVRITEDKDGDGDESAGTINETARPDVVNSGISDNGNRNVTVDNPSIYKLSTTGEVPEHLENTQMSHITTSGCGNLRHQEAVNHDIRMQQNTTSGCGKSRHLDAVKSGTNNTYTNNTEHSKTDLIESISFDKPVKLIDCREITDHRVEKTVENGDKDGIDDDPLIKRIKENIQYDWHMSHDNISDRESWQNYFEIIKGMVIGEREKVRIGDAIYPYSFVRDRFLSLTEQHIYYAQDRVEKEAKKIHNIKAYMTTTLFHAPETMTEYYRQLCEYNEEGDGWYERRKSG